MTRVRPPLIALVLTASITVVVAQSFESGGWPTYNGDYSGRRFSPLKQITASNVNALTLAWMYRISDVWHAARRRRARSSSPRR